MSTRSLQAFKPYQLILVNVYTFTNDPWGGIFIYIFISMDLHYTLSTRSLQAFLALSAYTRECWPTFTNDQQAVFNLSLQYYELTAYCTMYMIKYILMESLMFLCNMYTVAARVFAGLQIWIRAHSYDFSRSESIKPGIG